MAAQRKPVKKVRHWTPDTRPVPSPRSWCAAYPPICVSPIEFVVFALLRRRSSGCYPPPPPLPPPPPPWLSMTHHRHPRQHSMAPVHGRWART
jgi:hypothetical protein